MKNKKKEKIINNLAVIYFGPQGQREQRRG